MNTELKAIVDLGIAAAKTAKDAAEGKDFMTVLAGDLYSAASKIPAVAANWSSLKDEVAQLSGTEAEKDLAAYVMQRLPEVVEHAKAVRIVGASLKLAVDLAQDLIELKAAIES
jgi:hypothetical protein